ncbi:hypothetical protein LAWI1_G000709, partial [Lachnellula willkommii]
MVDYTTCQNSGKGLVHGESPDDVVLHYFGCLKFSERADFLAELDETNKLKLRIREETKRIEKLRDIFEAEGPRTSSGKVLDSFKKTLSHWSGIKRSYTHLEGAIPDPGTLDGPEERAKEWILDDMRANVIYFKKHHEDDDNPGPYDHPAFVDNFPNQKISLKQLLSSDKEKNPLMWPCEPNMIRYFHLPANNMEWIEEAMARFYNEEIPDLNGPYRKARRGHPESKTRMLFRPQYWRGLQHGDRVDLPTHTRHMRPRCYRISTNHQSTETRPKNLALFMPYLHWETDRRRARAANIIGKYGPNRWSPMVEVVEEVRIPVIKSTIDRTTSDGFLEHITARTEIPRPNSATHKITHKTFQGQKLLGRLLFLAAALYEAMDAYTDEKIIERYLMGRPPLHPRRTLDQSYYWTLKDTSRRDRDQVVYRETAPSPKLVKAHHSCTKKDPTEKDKTCDQCLENVRKTPRVVMVDQLWMWVLDENTIITCFPKRWGKNKPDESAVQKCIRTRLREARIDEVRSVHDLALIIIDQCSRVFFDRTQPTDMQPQVMDAFANAIGRVTHKQTISFEHFWECTRMASKRYNDREEPDNGTSEKSQNVLLDINPEGELLREIRDIIDELFIMMQIKTQEQNVISTFVKHIKRLISPIRGGGENSIDNRSEHSLPGNRRPARPSLSFRNAPAIQFDHESETEDYDLTMTCAVELLESTENQLLELSYLKEAAENASLALKDLLDLKQQQAGVVEAREAVKQGEETLKQGRAIMLFTIVTIVFVSPAYHVHAPLTNITKLPLSFFTGVFGMNATNLTGTDGPNLWQWGDIFVFMIPISVLVTTISLLLAFSKLIRALLSFAFHISWTWLITHTPAYVSWRETTFT